MFDVQIKRIHEYKRQLLNILEIIALYLAIRLEPDRPWTPRVKIFAGKAAASYERAKLIIKLANDVAQVINADPKMGGRLKVAFLPNYNVSLAQDIIPAADLSEQISTAGMEASGTGNMKLALNGALTIGTLDGANIEIRDAVGPDNFFLFGLSAEEVARQRRDGYAPRRAYEADAELRETLDLIASGFFSDGDRELFRPLVQSLLTSDNYMLLADYRSYVDCQDRVSKTYRDARQWTRMSILNTSRVGAFSSDRSIREYCRDVWQVEPIKIENA
jgi:starch phosphorylase